MVRLPLIKVTDYLGMKIFEYSKKLFKI